LRPSGLSQATVAPACVLTVALVPLSSRISVMRSGKRCAMRRLQGALPRKADTCSA
jgi:hypothetical protein